MVKHSQVTGVMRLMDITSCTMNIDGDDGKKHELEFEVQPRVADYYLMMTRRVKCLLEDGIIQSVSLLD